MFSLEAIKSAQSKIGSGADFPGYIRELKQLGLARYETHIADGHTDFYHESGALLRSEPRPQLLEVSPVANRVAFGQILKEHQQGRSDFATFSRQCAEFGVDGWTVRLDEMTCTYHDIHRNIVLVEEIPG